MNENRDNNFKETKTFGLNWPPIGFIDEEQEETLFEEKDNDDGAIYDNDNHNTGLGLAD